MKTFTEYCAGKVIGETQAQNSTEAGKKLAQRYLYPESIILVNKEASLKLHAEGKSRSELLASNALLAGKQIALVTPPLLTLASVAEAFPDCPRGWDMVEA